MCVVLFVDRTALITRWQLKISNNTRTVTHTHTYKTLITNHSVRYTKRTAAASRNTTRCAHKKNYNIILHILLLLLLLSK